MGQVYTAFIGGRTKRAVAEESLAFEAVICSEHGLHDGIIDIRGESRI